MIGGQGSLYTFLDVSEGKASCSRIQVEKDDYSLELVEDAFSGTTIVDELIADLIDDVLDNVDVNIAGIGTSHFSTPQILGKIGKKAAIRRIEHWSPEMRGLRKNFEFHYIVAATTHRHYPALVGLAPFGIYWALISVLANGPGRDGSGYGQGPPVPSAYGGPDNNYPPPPSSYGGNNNYPPDAVPPPASYGGGGASYPPSYGAPAGYGGNAPADARGGGRAGPPARFDGGYSGGAYGSSDEAPLKVKQCDENCGDSCDNSRIYISNLPPDVTIDELRELFGSIGQVARIKQKRGYKDQWPWSIKLYTDEQGNNKGDAVLSYEDPSAAHSAGGFFNNHMLRGNKISVVMAEKSAPKAAPAYGSRGGGRGGYGGGDRRRDNYRDGGSGPDRNYHGGNRSRPY
nr:transcription initiation factor TFIID subunit 15B [Ipomoea batatas]